MPSKTKSFPSFDSPAHLLATYDLHVRNGNRKLYPWQIKIHKKVAEEPPQGTMSEIDVVAANGSGKSKMIVAPVAAYMTCQYDKSETVLTTASGQQLDRQSARYLRDFASQMNKEHKDVWEIQHRKLTFRPTDGIIDLFATDEAGQAEGWHQRDYDTAFTIIVDEAKSLHEDIYVALDRCHDAQRYLKVSSPGKTSGSFYKSCTSGKSNMYRINAFDCPHISLERINRIISIYGRHSPKTKSIIDALFSSDDEQIVITKDSLDELFNEPYPILNTTGQPLRVGLDLAAGGDENVASIWQGNVQLGLECFVEKDGTVTADKVEFILQKYKFKKDSEFMFADDGGVGRPIIDILRRNKGWNIKRVLNQSPALDTYQYGNRGAELWFRFASFIVNRELRMLNDDLLREQLANRFYTQQKISGKTVLESKRDAKLRGHPSPDRADATVLAFTGMIAPYYSLIGKVDSEKEDKKPLTMQEMVEIMDRKRYGSFEEYQLSERKKALVMINGSQGALIDPYYITSEELCKQYGWK